MYLTTQADRPGGTGNLDQETFDPGDPAKTADSRYGTDFLE